MTKQTCQRCGHTPWADEPFCGQCGARLGLASTSTPTSPSQEISLGDEQPDGPSNAAANAGRPLRILLGVGAACILGFVGLSALGSLGSDDAANGAATTEDDTEIEADEPDEAAEDKPTATATRQATPAPTTNQDDNKLDSADATENDDETVENPNTVIPDWSRFTDLYDGSGVLAVNAGGNEVTLVDLETGRTATYKSRNSSFSRFGVSAGSNATTSGLVSTRINDVVVTPWAGGDDIVITDSTEGNGPLTVLSVDDDRVVTFKQDIFETDEFSLQIHDLADGSTTSISLPPTATGPLFTWSPGGVDPLTIHGGAGLMRWAPGVGWRDLGPGSSIAHSSGGMLVEQCEAAGESLACAYSTVTYEGERVELHPSMSEKTYFGAVLSDDLRWMATVSFGADIDGGPPAFVVTELATGATGPTPTATEFFPSGYWLPDSSVFALIAPGQPLRLVDAETRAEAEINDVPWNDYRSSDEPASVRVLDMEFPEPAAE